MTIEQALREASVLLSKVSERPRLEAEILMSHLLHKERTWLHTHSDESLGDEEGYRRFVERRRKSEPIEYIVGRVSFYDVELEVGKGVLIARPETELLVDMAAEVIRKHRLQRICEIGVGSGAVSIVLARKFPHLTIVATDISREALGYAEKNIKKYGLHERIELVHTNLLDGVSSECEMIVSNPPYICKAYLLPHSVRYEPQNALIGGECGDELLKEIILTAKRRKIPHLICEMGYDQRESIADFCTQKRLPAPRFYKDLAGLDRGFYLQLATKSR
ncbi:peptide chain release factor N(5)-glutamine methyltransferase [Hydrogenimonas urashimensis]|uniref:peptide chain release factor N(5)-glutamine methyltransferase n=1 Tax=Hydrogenimonas urashimensis TaxID=2740515 RepID=UPI001914E47F|nr:peptide chain release factor N(5)-glutamine methyltransferase [Hydrogenimonas urashimensis]